MGSDTILMDEYLLTALYSVFCNSFSSVVLYINTTLKRKSIFFCEGRWAGSLIVMSL